MSDSEINDAVAKKLGRLVGHNPAGISAPYSTSIEVAWEIVGWLEKNKLFLALSDERHVGGRSNGWLVEITNDDDEIEADDEADTPQMAICKAFLKL